MSSIYLLHADPRVAERLRETIQADSALRVVGTATTLEQARKGIEQTTPDLILSDLWLPDGSVSGFLGQLRRNGRHGKPHWVVMSTSGDDPRLLPALRSGADGYVAPGQACPPLLEVLKQVLAGESLMSPQIARQVKAHFDASVQDPTDVIGESQNPLRLSETERLLLERTAEGYLVPETASSLKLSSREVGQRIRAVYRKLQFDWQAAGLSLRMA